MGRNAYAFSAPFIFFLLIITPYSLEFNVSIGV